MSIKCKKCNEIIALTFSEFLSGKYKKPKASSINASNKGLCEDCFKNYGVKND